MVKPDPEGHPGMASSAEVVGARIFHAAGYNAPCNEVLRFGPEALVLAPQAVRLDHLGRKRPLTQAQLSALLALVPRGRDGRFVAAASHFLPGVPIGPFRWEGTRKDDPNDVVPHEDRRELRATRLLNAWLGRYDVREQNSLDTVIVQQGRRFVRHYQLDFGDGLGFTHDDRRNRRLNHAHFVDFGQIFVDFVSLGLVRRPWHRPAGGDRAGIFRYYGWRDFVPSRWKPNQPNPAYVRMTWRDALWITRILVRLEEPHLRAIVRSARLEDGEAEAYLLRALRERQQRIAREYLRKYVPLDRFAVERERSGGRWQEWLCFDDLGIAHAGLDAREVGYEAEVKSGAALERVVGRTRFSAERHALPAGARSGGARSCFRVPLAGRPASVTPGDGVAAGEPSRYRVVRVSVLLRRKRHLGTAVLHFYDLGEEAGLVLVGIEREPSPAPRPGLFRG
jgi:hypothetical protein